MELSGYGYDITLHNGRTPGMCHHICSRNLTHVTKNISFIIIISKIILISKIGQASKNQYFWVYGDSAGNEGT